MRVTQRKGDGAGAQALATFTQLGFDVSVPFTESASYDLIVDVEGELFRLQCKYCAAKREYVDLRRIHSNAQGYVVKKNRINDYDWLYVLDDKGNEYLFKTCFAGRSGVALNPKFFLKQVISRVNVPE